MAQQLEVVQAEIAELPTVFMQVGARGDSSEITTLGFFPALTRQQKQILSMSFGFYEGADLGYYIGFIGAEHVCLVQPETGLAHTEINCDGLEQRARQVGMRLPPMEYARESRDLLALEGARVILDEEVKKLGPTEHLFQGLLNVEDLDGLGF